MYALPYEAHHIALDFQAKKDRTAKYLTGANTINLPMVEHFTMLDLLASLR